MFGEPPNNSSFHINNDQWEKHDFSKGWIHIMTGLLLGLLITLILDFLITTIMNYEEFRFSVIKNLHLLIMIIPLHELLHVLLLPDKNKAIVGISIKKGIFYVTTDEAIRKSRFLLISLAPLIFLTIIPLISLIFYKINILAHIALINMLASGIDLKTFFYIMKQPKGSVFRLNGSDLYSKVIKSKRL